MFPPAPPVNRPPRDDCPSRPPYVPICALGLAVRGVFLFLTRGLDLQSDEANYVYLGLTWDHLGVYLDQHRYLWPPGYPGLLALMLGAFGAEGMFATRVVQVLASTSIGASTMALAARLFGRRAAVWAGLAWALYLPLVAFTHLLWNETLFLAFLMPALLQALAVLQAPPGTRVDGRLVAAGLCFAGALYVKEAPLYLAPLIAVLLAALAGDVVEGLRRASLFLLALAAAVLPWTLRNQEVYGRLAPVGSSLGENCYQGLNAEYRNFDLIPLEKERALRGLPPLTASLRPWFVAPPATPEWSRAEEVTNTIDRLDENTRRGLALARAEPGWLVRSRIKKLADLVVPSSFFTRHLALGGYAGSPISAPPTRRALGVWAVLCPVLALLLGSAGWFLALRDRAGLWLFGTVGAYFTATALLVSMSRFRLPLEPLLIVLAAGLVAGGALRRGRLAVAGVAATWTALAFLWWVSLPEHWRVFADMVWGGAA